MSQEIEQAIRIRIHADGTREIVNISDELDKLKAKAGSAAAGATPLGAALGNVAQQAALGSPQISAMATEMGRLHSTLQAATGGTSGLLGAIGGLRGASSALLPITVGAIAVGAAFAAIAPAVQAAAESADSFRKLDAAIRRTGDTAAATFPEIERSIQAVFDASAFDDEPLRRAATTFVTITGNAKDAAKAIGPISDLAAAMGIDVESAAGLVAKATEGMTGSLQRAGVVFTDVERKFMETADQGQRLSMVLEKISSKVGGAAASELETYAGQVANLKKNWGELVEGLGVPFLAVVVPVIGYLADVAKGANAAADAVIRFMRARHMELDLGKAAFLGAGASGSWEAPQQYGPTGSEPGFVKARADADKKALDAATGAAKAYRDSVDSLLGLDKGFGTDIRATVEAFGKLKAAMGEDAAMKAFGPALADIGDKIARLGVQVPAASRAVLDQAVAFRDGQKAAKDAAAQLEALAAWNLKNEQGFQKSAEKVSAFAAALAEIPTAISGPAMAEIRAVFASIDAMRANPIAAFGPLNPDALAEMVRRAEEAGDIVVKSIGDSALAAGKGIATAMQDALADSVARFQEAVHDLGQVMGDVFLDLGETGGANFGRIAAQLFVKNVQDSADKLAEMFGGIVIGAFGGAPDPAKFAQGEKDPEFLKAQKAAVDQQAAVMGALNGAIGLIGQTMNIFANAKKGQETSVLGTTISFAAAGASIGSLFPGLGTIIGAAVGAIAGAIVGLLANAKAKKEQPYAAYGIRDGEAYVEAFAGQERQFENVTASMRNDMLQRMRKTMEETANGYTALLLKFPLRVIAGLNLGIESIDFAPTMDNIKKVTRGWFSMLIDPLGVNLLANAVQGLPLKPGTTRVVGDRDGEIGNPNVDKAARKSFLDDFNNWVENTLPKEIAAQFHDRTASAFTAMGMTVTQFDTVWAKLQGMDAKEAMQVLNDMADALISFDKVFSSMRGMGRKLLEGLRSGNEMNQYGTVRAPGISQFQSDMAGGLDNLIKLGIAIYDLTGPEQVSAAKALGQTLEQMQQNLISFLNQIIEINSELSKAIADQRFGIKLDQAASPQEKSDLLMQQYRNVIDQINNAKALGLSPQDVQGLTQDAMDLINRIYQIDTKGRADWADAELQKLDRLQTEILKQLGDAAISLFQEVVNSMQPVVDWFKGLPEVAGAPLDELANSARNAAEALDGIARNWKQNQDAMAPVVAPAMMAMAPPPPELLPGETLPPNPTGLTEVTDASTAAFAAGPNSAGWSGSNWTFMDGVSPEMRSYFIQNSMAGMRSAGELPEGATPLITPYGGERMATEGVTQSVLERQTIALERIARAVEEGDAESREIARETLGVLRTGRDIRLDPGELTINVNEAAPRRTTRAPRDFIAAERYRRVMTMPVR